MKIASRTTVNEPAAQISLKEFEHLVRSLSLALALNGAARRRYTAHQGAVQVDAECDKLDPRQPAVHGSILRGAKGTHWRGHFSEVPNFGPLDSLYFLVSLVSFSGESISKAGSNSVPPTQANIIVCPWVYRFMAQNVPAETATDPPNVDGSSPTAPVAPESLPAVPLPQLQPQLETQPRNKGGADEEKEPTLAHKLSREL